jgi:hypothetical protein
MRVVVEYVLSVPCEVDTDIGEVVRVWTSDGELSATEQCFGAGGGRFEGAEATQAMDIAARGVWPPGHLARPHLAVGRTCPATSPDY